MSRSGRQTLTDASVSAVDLTDLFGRRLLFVTGKGGTGKSTVAAAIAARAAARGLRTLACEMDAKGSLAPMLGLARAPGYTPVRAPGGVDVMSMNTEESLREYLRIHLRLPLVTKIGPLAAAFDFVADAAPGVREVLAVGKVCWEVRENHYDLVVVDAEASGHVVSQIASPRTIADLVPRGPLREQTSWMLDILDDPRRCGVVIVANPEELAVAETLQLVEAFRRDTHTDIVSIVMNRVAPEPGALARDLASDDWFVRTAPDAAGMVTAASARNAAHQTRVAQVCGAVPEVECTVVPRLDASGVDLTEAVGGFLR